MRTGLVIVETTLPAGSEGERLVAQLVEERLAACANWLPLRSTYWWQGKLENAEEIHVSFKTSRRMRNGLVEALRRRHPYDVPYIAWHETEAVNEDYARWVDDETKGGSNSNPSD